MGSNINPILKEKIPSFIKKNKLSYTVKAGEWKVNEPIILHGNLILNKNTLLKFNNDSYILVKGSLKVNGTENNPIIMKSINKKALEKGYMYLMRIKITNKILILII